MVNKDLKEKVFKSLKSFSKIHKKESRKILDNLSGTKIDKFSTYFKI